MNRTILKWVGSKAGIMHELVKRLPAGKRLVEPFAGSCSVMMNTDYQEYLVADVNPDLINMYQQIKGRPAAFIKHAELLFEKANSEDEYYRRREEFRGNTLDAWDRAVIFLYLNRHGYRGVCRYKQKGEYNVPYGKYKQPYFPKTEILAFAEKAKRATFICADFRATLEMVKHRDVVYCDPPYLPISKSANFSTYHTGGFSYDDHVDLTIDLMNVSESRAPVVISNSDTPATRARYHAFSVESITAPRSVGNPLLRIGDVVVQLADSWSEIPIKGIRKEGETAEEATMRWRKDLETECLNSAANYYRADQGTEQPTTRKGKAPKRENVSPESIKSYAASINWNLSQDAIRRLAHGHRVEIEGQFYQATPGGNISRCSPNYRSFKRGVLERVNKLRARPRSQ